MKNRKLTLSVIIILLVIFLPITIFATTTHFNKKEVVDNPEHQFKYKEKLYFYDKDTLLGTYECQNFTEYCDLASTRSNFYYSLNEYKPEKNSKIPIIENRYAFLWDTEMDNLLETEYVLYDIVEQRVLAKYKEVKNYGIGIENDLYIVQNAKELWGIVQLNSELTAEIPCEYSYLGLVNRKDTESGKIIADYFAALKDNTWSLIDLQKAEFTGKFTQEIVSYDGQYVILKENDLMALKDYQGKSFLEPYPYINFYSKYLMIIDNNSEFYLYDLSNEKVMSKTYKVESIEEVRIETENNQIEIYIRENLEESIEIS